MKRLIGSVFARLRLMASPAPAEPSPVTRRELICVGAALLISHLLLMMRGLPFPHHDAFFFTEPALFLAREGNLVAPSAQYLDLTYVVNFGAYPPVYFVALAAWLRVFDYSAGSLLGFTHTIHVLYLAAVWLLSRVRFRTPPFGAALVVASCFPFFNHGRPDLLATLLGTMAWLALPDAPHRGRSVAAVALLALTFATSPALGLSSIAAITLFVVMHSGRPTPASLKHGVTFGAAGFAGGLALWALVLTWQGSWAIAPTQFRVNSSVRGKDLNELPALLEFVSPYFFAFVHLPLVFAAVFPALLALFRRNDTDRDRTLRSAAIAYLGALLPLLLFNKRQLLYQHHFALMARPSLHAALLASTGLFRVLGVLAVLAFTASQIVLTKETFIYLFAGDVRYETVDARKLAGARVLAVDSNYAPALFGRFDGVLLDYNIIKFNQWRDYRTATPAALLERVPARLREGPEVPDVILLSSRGESQVGAPNPALFEKVSGPQIETINVFGFRLRQIERPFAIHVYRRRSGALVPDAL